MISTHVGIEILHLHIPWESLMFMDLIRSRRSIRKYADRPVEKEKIDLLVEAALRAPTSRDFHPWEFVVVTDTGLLEKLSEAKPTGSVFLKDAPLGVVVTGRPGTSDVWVEDCSIASTFIQLAAQSLGLGSCWIQIRERWHHDSLTAGAHVARCLDLPPDIAVESMIAVGYPSREKAPHSREELLFEKVHYNRFGERSAR
jgi:nitroreductase